MTRTQTVALVSAALIAALIGLVLLLTLLAMDADDLLANAVAEAMRGQMRLGDLADAMTKGAPVVHRYLSK